MAQSIRTASSILARAAARSSIRLSRRTFAVSAVSRKPDLIQDMYLKELRAYKPPEQKASDAEGHVQKFSPPAAPKSPEESNIASEIKEYESQTVEIEGQAAAGETTEAQDDYFEDLKHLDEEAPAHGH